MYYCLYFISNKKLETCFSLNISKAQLNLKMQYLCFSEREATVMRANSWLYHYYMVQTKLQYGLAYDTHASTRISTPYYQQAQPYQEPAPAVASYHQMSPSQLTAPPHHLHTTVP